MTNEISTQTDNEFMAELAAQAKAVAAKERPDLARVSTRAGILAYNGEAIKGNKLQCVIVGMAYENAYYIDEFDADNPKNPACFAVATVDDGMTPHPTVPIKFNQLDKGPTPAADCSGCWAAQWKSDPGGGKGKACKQKRRLLLLPTDALESPEAVRKAELAVLTLPVMSVKNYSKYVNGLAAQGGLPPWAVVTEVSTAPNVKSQFTVELNAVKPITDVAVLKAIRARQEEFDSLVTLPFEPYVETTDEPAGDKPAAKSAKKKF